MRIAVIRAGRVVALIEASVRTARQLFPTASGHDCVPVGDFSAAEPGASATVQLRWGSGRIRRARVDRQDGVNTFENHPDTDEDA